VVDPLTGSGLGKRIGTRILWSGLDVEFSPGTITALVGPSEVGKTMLLNCLGLLEPLTEGMVAYNGASVSSRGKQRRLLFRRSFGFMFQNFLLHHPEIVFVDEPTASLDDRNGDNIIDLLRTLTTAGAIVIVPTHDTHVQDRADATADLSPGR